MVQTEEKYVEVQQVQIIKRIAEVLRIHCQKVIRHVMNQQVTGLPRWCLRLTSDPTQPDARQQEGLTSKCLGHHTAPSRRRRSLGRRQKGVDYMAVLISGVEVWRGFSGRTYV